MKLTEVLPKSGLLYSEKGALSEVLSKPKIMPLKSVTLERIEEMERQAAQAAEFSRSVATAQRQEHQAQSSFLLPGDLRVGDPSKQRAERTKPPLSLR